MKLTRYTSMFAAFLLFLVGCNSDLDKTYFDPEKVTSSTLEKVKESYTLDQPAADNVIDTFTWGKMDFGYPADIKYTVEVDLLGKEFKTAQPVVVVSNTKAEIITKSLNAAVLAVLKANEMTFEEGDEPTLDVEFRIQARISDAAAPVYSLNVETSKVTPYYVAEYPEELFMIGAQFGNWGWDDKGVVNMIPVHSKLGMFWTVKYIEADKGFKFNSIKDWTGSFALLDENIGVKESGGNAVVSETGLYTIFVDLQNKTLAVEPAEVYGIGDVFGSWDKGEVPFTHQQNLMNTTAIKAGELRMYASSPYSRSKDVDWWHMEFIILSGKIEYRGTGGDQERVKVVEGQKVTLDFNDETGIIE